MNIQAGQRITILTVVACIFAVAIALVTHVCWVEPEGNTRATVIRTHPLFFTRILSRCVQDKHTSLNSLNSTSIYGRTHLNVRIYPVTTTATRHRASSWHFAFALQHPCSLGEMERRTQQARPCYRRRGESVFAGMRSACGVRWLADNRLALPRVSIVLP